MCLWLFMCQDDMYPYTRHSICFLYCMHIWVVLIDLAIHSWNIYLITCMHVYIFTTCSLKMARKNLLCWISYMTKDLKVVFKHQEFLDNLENINCIWISHACLNGFGLSFYVWQHSYVSHDNLRIYLRLIQDVPNLKSMQG